MNFLHWPHKHGQKELGLGNGQQSRRKRGESRCSKFTDGKKLEDLQELFGSRRAAQKVAAVAHLAV